MSRFFLRIISFSKNFDHIIFLLLLSACLLLPRIAHGAINIDGVINEAEWTDAQTFRDFVVVDPLTMETPRFPTEARILSLPEGLAVAFICYQPPDETRAKTTTMRDASRFDSDYVSLMIDFNSTHLVGYEFSVSITNSYRDGNITDESKFSYDWDGVWQHAVNEEPERWTAELLLPRSIVAMRDVDGDTRQIAVCFQRVLNSRNEKFSYPGASTSRTKFMSDFAMIEVAKYAEQEFDILPYVTVLSDMVKKSTKAKAGLDLFWKPSGRFQLAATINPDFGQVESDDLVINFSATETFYSDKRPFFTENEGLFVLTTPPSSYIIHTRRIGGKSDDGRPVSDIDGALKIIGSIKSSEYGILAARETGNAGRSFFAGRLKVPTGFGSVGMVTTFVDRPFLDRQALVNSLDYTINEGNFFSRGRLTMSDISGTTNNKTGYGLYTTLTYKPSDAWQYQLTYSLYNDALDFNDMGYLKRNNWDEGFISFDYRQAGFPEDSRTASVTWSGRYTRSYNFDGVRLQSSLTFGRSVKTRSGSDISTQISYYLPGYDDLVSRGNGLVYLNGLLSTTLSYSTQRRGIWRKSISFKVFQEGYDDWAMSLEGSASLYLHETFTMDLSLKPLWSRDWLIWMRGNQFASFSRRQLSINIGATWFPAERHEVRLRTQWIVINADADRAFRIGPYSRLILSNDHIDSFAALNFGLQLRYRYEIGPLSEFYLVYSRGGADRINDPDRGTMGLLGTSTGLRDSDQVLAKLRYRF